MSSQRRKHRVEQLQKNFLEEKAEDDFPVDIAEAMAFFEHRFTKRKVAEYIEGIPGYKYDSGKIEVVKNE